MNQSRAVSLWSEGLLAACFFVALTMVLAYPYSIQAATTVLPMGADTDLLLWLFAWDVHAFVHNPLSIFDANIYYPYRHTLAYSENVIGSALLAAPIQLATGNTVLALNVASLLTCVLCGLGTYILIRRVGFGPAAGVLGGLIFAFAPPRFFRLGQVHLGAIQWIPFALAFLHQYFDTGLRRKLWWACGFFAMQTFTSGHGAVFAAISIALLIVWRVALGEPLAIGKRVRDLSVPGAALLVISVLPVLPYRAVQQEVGLRRTLGDAYSWAPNLATLLASPTHVHAWLLSLWPGWPILAEAKAFLFPGYLALLLGIVGVWGLRRKTLHAPAEPATGWTRLATVLEIAFVLSLLVALAATVTGGFRLRIAGYVLFSARSVLRAWLFVVLAGGARLALRRRVPIAARARALGVRDRYRRLAAARRTDAVAFYALLAVVTYWLALGPEFGLYRLVYDLPGFNFIRVPTRYSMPALLGLSVVAAGGFEHLTARVRPGTRHVIALALGAILVAEYTAVPFTSAPYRIDIPAADRWLATQEKPFVVAELPLSNPDNIPEWERRQSQFMLHSLAHWQRTVHGYSGVRPALHSALFDEMTRFPDEVSLLGLTEIGVTHVVVHTDWYHPSEWARVEGQLKEFGEFLTLRHEEDGGRVYTLTRPSADRLVRRRFDAYVETMTRADAAARATLYTPDALMVRPGGWIVRGRAAVAEWLAANVNEPDEVTALEATQLTVEGNAARIEGRFRQRGRSAEAGRFQQVWVLVNGQWKLQQDLYSPGPVGSDPLRQNQQ